MYAYRFTDGERITKSNWSFCADDFNDNLVKAIELASKKKGVVYLEMVDILELLDIYEILTGGGGLALKRIKLLKVVGIEKGNLAIKGNGCIYNVSWLDDTDDIIGLINRIREHNLRFI